MIIHTYHCCCYCHLQLLLDGRDITVPGYEKGNFVGPTILHDVKVRIVQFIV